MELETFIKRQRRFSRKTFGPGERLDGVVAHIRKELREVKKTKGRDIVEWADVIILALDGAWRQGFTPAEICEALDAKLQKNTKRDWPDWRTAGPGPIEHVRGKND